MVNEEAVGLVEEEGIMNTKAQAKKEQIINELQKVRSEILTEVAALSPKERNTVFLGIWSVKDILAHLVGWDFANMEAVHNVLEGKLPAFYEYHDHDWQTFNALLVEKYKKGSFKELLASVKDSHIKLVELAKSVPVEKFNKDFGIRFRRYKVTVQRLLEADIKDVRIHHQQIVDFFSKAK